MGNQEINGHTRLCGLIGNPVEHTMSPVIHNNLAIATGDNMVYVPFHVDFGQLESAVLGAYGLNILGMNVTVPYKSDVIPFLKDIDPLAKKIGACNTLVRMDGGFKGYNTDMPGLYRAMKYDGVEIEGKEVVILGAGGVARAVAMLLATYGARKVYMFNRTLEKAALIANEVNSLFEKEFVIPMELGDAKLLPENKKYLVIQATGVGMHPNVEQVVIEDPAFYDKVEIGYDLIFNPLDTRFMKLCREHGAEAFNGYRMLLFQGVIAYELWTGKQVDDALAMKIYDKMLEALK